MPRGLRDQEVFNISATLSEGKMTLDSNPGGQIFVIMTKFW